jgi:hypothetical protein
LCGGRQDPAVQLRAAGFSGTWERAGYRVLNLKASQQDGFSRESPIRYSEAPIVKPVDDRGNIQVCLKVEEHVLFCTRLDLKTTSISQGAFTRNHLGRTRIWRPNFKRTSICPIRFSKNQSRCEHPQISQYTDINLIASTTGN